MVKPVNTARPRSKKALLKKQSTVLIVDAHRTKTLTVNTFFLKTIQPILRLLTVLTLLLTVGLGVLGYEYFQNTVQTRALEAEVNQLKSFTSAEIEAKLSALKASENTVVQLQDYLKAKGVSVKPVDFQTRRSIKPEQNQSMTAAAGGPELPVSAPIPFVGDFSEQTSELFQKARSIPLGLPHDGELSSRFGLRHNPFTKRGGEMHGGLDFRGTTGEPIHVTADGEVDFAGVQRGYGNVVIVKHAYGYKTYYAHLSAINVTKGDTLQSGDVVGKLGSTGRSTGPHLHYEVRLNNKRLDPENFLSIENVTPSA